MDRLSYQQPDHLYNHYPGYLDDGRYNGGDEYAINNASLSVDYNNPDYPNHLDQFYQPRPNFNIRPPSRNVSEAGNSYLGSSRMPTHNINRGFAGHPTDVVSNLSEDANPLDERFSEHSSVIGGRNRANNPVPVVQERPISRNSYRPSYVEPSQNDGWIPQSSFMLNDPTSGLLNNSYKPHSTHTLNKTHSSNQFDPSSDSKFREPELAEVIGFLSHHSDAVKANAAAYLQHLSYMDDNIKAQTRALRGIPPLLELVNHPLPEVHRSACGALRNLSYGRANDHNKIEIMEQDGITTLVRLIRKTKDQDVLELVTGIIWNLSSCANLKKSIIDEGLKTLLDHIIVPLSGSRRSQGIEQQNNIPNYRSVTFRNASGVLRNISSDGEHARKKMRDCEGLIESLIRVIGWSISNKDPDNKSIENCVCVLRNLSYACQEVADPDYLRNRLLNLNSKDPKTGCFGNKSKSTNKQKSVTRNQTPIFDQSKNTKQMFMLWSPKILDIYLPLLSEASNPETLEATAGAIQNLAACDWQPSVELRAAVRKEKGLAIISNLLNYSSDRVVCATATALRNLALDDKNKELIGKQAMDNLVSKLPSSPEPTEFPLSNETLAAIESALYEIIKSNSSFARTFIDKKGVNKLMSISKSPPGIFSVKVVKYARQLLQKIWKYTELHDELKKTGWKLTDFNYGTIAGQSSAENTINRPIMAQGRTYQDNNSLQRPSTQMNKDYLGGMPYSVPIKDEDMPLDTLHEMQLNDKYGGPRNNLYTYNNGKNNLQASYSMESPTLYDKNISYNRPDPYIDPYHPPDGAITPLPGYSDNSQMQYSNAREYPPFLIPADQNNGTIRSISNANMDQMNHKMQSRSPNNTDSWV